MTLAIEVRGLRKAYGRTAVLHGIDLDVPTGGIVGLLGPNGAGKTTTINCLTTLLAPDAGTARVAGYDVRTQPARVRGSIAVTGQFAAVDIMLTGRENLVLFGRLLRLGRAQARRRADELLARFDLADAAGKPVKAYSGGMRRRLDLAISMVVPRPVLFLDEPTTGLDPRSRGTTWEVVRELRDAGTTVLLTTQYLEEADQLADRLAVIDHGRVIAEGTARELKDRAGGAVCEIRLRSPEELRRVVGKLGGRAHEVGTGGGNTVTVPAPDTRTLVEIAAMLDAAGIEPEDLVRRRPTLDDVFLALTGQPETVPA